jgi:glycosyltransferase involved in cell wall biosynthesis
MPTDVFATPWPLRPAGAVTAFRDAVTSARALGNDLLVLFGKLSPAPEAIGVMQQALQSDPMLGFAAARLTGSTGRSIACLGPGGDPAIDELPRRILAEIPETYLTADVPARCLLIRSAILADFGDIDERFLTVAGALWRLMTRARRCGFRTVVCNRAVIASFDGSRPCAPCTVPLRSLPEHDRILLRELASDLERTLSDFGPATLAATESRLARGIHGAYGTRPSLLLDARNMVKGMNGTTAAALGICGGLHAVRSGWDITLLTSRDAAAFHDLAKAFPGWQIATALPSRQFTAALRLSQPWHLQEMIDLHSLAVFNGYLFLDTISWDITYSAPRNLNGVWQFMADHADALLFNSAFTQERFRRRFPAASRPELVAYHSFAPEEYMRADIRLAEEPDRFIFVVGNDYDHKDVAPTTRLLATAFPYESIVALGGFEASTPRVTVLQSGGVPEPDMHRLYAGARVVVFPSFYEGFGFPILATLAYGGTVVVRRSALVEEIAARAVARGRIVPFDRRDDLVEIVGRLLHGDPVETIPVGSALHGEAPLSWRGVAERITAFLREVTSDPSRSRWRSREHTIVQLLAAPATLNEKRPRRPAIVEAAPDAVMAAE